MAERYFKSYLGDLILMPSDYCDRKIRSLSEENEKLLEDLGVLDKQIEEGLRDVFPELGGDFGESD
jgi:hypothetical protein